MKKCTKILNKPVHFKIFVLNEIFDIKTVGKQLFR